MGYVKIDLHFDLTAQTIPAPTPIPRPLDENDVEYQVELFFIYGSDPSSPNPPTKY